MLWWMVQNAVVAAFLAVLVVLVCRLFRPRPALRHTLWLLVLLKLLTPPVITWPWAPPDVFARVSAVTALRAPDRMDLAHPLAPGISDRAERLPADLATGLGSNREERPRPAAALTRISEPDPPTVRPGTVQPSVSRTKPHRVSILASVWLVGAAATLLFQFIGIVRARRRVTRAEPVPPFVSVRVEEMAARLGVKAPQSCILPGLAQPVLWCLWQPTLLWPEGFLEKVDSARLRGMMAHELAHLRRRDHWIGWLNLAAACIWWLYPLYWYVRRKLYETAELACDAWVVSALPESRRDYAEALVEVWEQGRRARIPAPAFGLGRGSRKHLKRRLTMIMRERMPCSVSKRGALAVALLALAVLPGWQRVRESVAGREAGASRVPVLTIHRENLEVPDDMKDCAENLRRIHAALMKYKQDNGRLPEWLSQLAPDYLDLESLHCAAADTGTGRRWPPDPNEKCSYGYPFAAYSYGEGLVYGETRAKEQKVYGDVYPLVRCWHHDYSKRILNLSMNGRIYVGYPYWTEALVDASGRRIERLRFPKATVDEGGKVVLPKECFDLPENMKSCAVRLKRIHEAIRKYKEQTGEMPGWLSDLVPAHLTRDALLCPHHPLAEARLNPDPKLPCSYGYQYSDAPYSGSTITYRQMKDAQREAVGDIVPMIRCYSHPIHQLNMAFDGRVFVSDSGWERMLPDDVLNRMRSTISETAQRKGLQPQPPAEAKEKFTVPEANLRLPDNMKACAANLEKIYAALKAYEEKNGRLPDWLSDLVPDYLHNETLFCDADSAHRSGYWPDPNKPCSYCYELNPRELRSRPPLDKTMRHYKEAQRKLLGDVVPIVRCFHHGGALNLSWGGQVYRSGVWFERLFLPNYSHRMLLEGAAEGIRPPSTAPRSTVTYKSDLEAFIREIDTTHPFFELKGIRDDWTEMKTQMREKLEDCKSDGEFMAIVLDAMRCLRDSHMGISQTEADLPRPPARYCPGVSFLRATDNRVVIMYGRDDSGAELKTGTVVTRIDGRDARQYLDRMSKAAWDKGGFGFSSPQRARLFEYRIPLRGERKGEKHTITILEGDRERVIELTSNHEARGWPHTYNRPKGMKQVGRSCWHTMLPSGVGYIYLRRVDAGTGVGMKEAFETYPDAKGWIIDLRGNGGGGYGQELFDALKRLPRPLAAIIDAGCFSAGETLARDLVHNGNARLFGSATAGSSSSKRGWEFPSGIATLTLSVRSRWGIDGKPIEFNGIQPHVKVEAVPEELQRGENSAILRAEEYLLGLPASSESSRGGAGKARSTLLGRTSNGRLPASAHIYQRL